MKCHTCTESVRVQPCRNKGHPPTNPCQSYFSISLTNKHTKSELFDISLWSRGNTPTSFLARMMSKARQVVTYADEVCLLYFFVIACTPRRSLVARRLQWRKGDTATHITHSIPTLYSEHKQWFQMYNIRIKMNNILNVCANSIVAVSFVLLYSVVAATCILFYEGPLYFCLHVCLFVVVFYSNINILLIIFSFLFCYSFCEM